MPHLPRSRKALSIATFDASLSDSHGSCDLGALTFIDAYGLVGTACALQAAEVPAQVRIVQPEAAAMRDHLVGMGFESFLATIEQRPGPPTGVPIEAPDVVVPLTSTADSGGAQVLSNLLWHQLRDHAAPQVLGVVAEGVWEMVGNALEHSGREALIMGQVYTTPRGRPPDHDDRVQVVIGDTGRGIRQSFLDAESHEPATDIDAINLALEYLVSSVVEDPGRGQGLSTTMEQVVELQGRMVVRSGTGLVSITSSGRESREVRFLPGVVVALSLPLYR